MPLTSPRYVNHGFFSNPGSTTADRLHKKPVFVDVGGNGDCGFRAVAACLIDGFLQRPRAYGELFSKVLASHFNYFPAHRTTLPGLVTPIDRVQQIIKQVRMGDLLQYLAYTLRQIAVTEMCAHPELYRGAFVERNEGTAPETMRKPTSWIDESSIAALAKGLGFPIEVQVAERGKILPMRLRYNDVGVGKPKVVMKLQDGHYTPRVSSVERFNTVRSQPVRELHPVTNSLTPDPSLVDIHAAIAAADERLVLAFEQAYDRLAVMVAVGELNKDDLLAMYVKNMTNSDYLAGRVACINAEHGTQHFFDAIIRVQRGLQKGALPADDNDQYIIDELIHALARAISIGQMSAENVFSQIDNTDKVKQIDEADEALEIDEINEPIEIDEADEAIEIDETDEVLSSSMRQRR